MNVKKNVPWHILAPSTIACDMFLLRASAHHWHVSAFLCNREFQGISYYTKRVPIYLWNPKMSCFKEIHESTCSIMIYS